MSTNVLGGAMELESPVLKPFVSIAVYVSMPKPEEKLLRKQDVYIASGQLNIIPY